MTTLTSTADHDLKTAINEELGWTPSVNCDRIGVAVNDGAVTLSGQVPSYPEKQAATSAALRVRGVSAVADEIVVQHTGSNHSDADIARAAGAALDKTVVVPVGSVKAAVHNHVIALTGSVGWEYQRHAAQHAVAGIPGVQGVSNRIVLMPPVAISPFAAKANITSALLRNAHLDAERVEVTVDGSKIRLTGKVSSWAERHQAEYAGWSTPGVTHVDNQLAIVPAS